MLTRAEKENRVIELYEQGRVYREIAKEVHMSPGDICSILREYTGEIRSQRNGERQQIQQQLQKTIDTKAFTLFEAGHAPIEVAIELDLKANDVTRFYKEYCGLKGLHGLSKVCEEIGDEISSFVKFYDDTKNAGIEPKQIVDALNISEQIPYIQDHFRAVRNDVFVLESQRKKLEDDMHDLNNQKTIAMKALDSCNTLFKLKQEEIIKLTYDKQRLELFIDGLTNNQKYQRVARIAKDNVRQVLDNKQRLLDAAICAVLDALKEHPEKQLLIYDSLDVHEYRTPFIPPGKDFEHYKRVCLENLLDLTEQVYDNLLNSLVSSTIIYSTSTSSSDLQSLSQLQ